MTNKPDTNQLEADICRYLIERYDRGNSYVRIHYIAKEIDTTPQSVTPIVRQLVEEGGLEVWRSPNVGADLYRFDNIREICHQATDDQHGRIPSSRQ